ncbi:MAG: DUF3500 domain-containing protein [Sphaerobacter sp.]|nr:DUF3500 domain-containing protein [Sphaerobacter sp.]
MASRHDPAPGHGNATLVARRMGEAAANFLAALTPAQRARATFPFRHDEERTRWFYTPTHRNGLPLAEMERHQQRLAHQLVATGLSRAGYVTASTIIGLETTLDYLERWRRPGRGRDPLLYYVSVFGEPSDRGAWGWRFEGHHVSLNYTIVDGRLISPTPTFFGANPAEAPLGGAAMLRPLAAVEDLARELIHLLTEEQRLAAVISPVAPPDIVLGNRPRVVDGALPLPTPVLSGAPLTPALQEAAEREWREMGLTPRDLDALRFTSTPRGLAAGRMTADQREVLTALIHAYIGRLPEEIAAVELAELRRLGIERIHFAWAGDIAPRRPHYYRLHGPRFVVEYDKTQDDANHIHSVWRDPENDFGADLLARHYAAAH